MTTTPAPLTPVCTAAERIERTLYEISLQRGQGIFDLGRLAAALTGANECDGHYTPEPAPFALNHYRPPFTGRAE